MVTQVVTYIRTPTPLLLLFIPYKFLVGMMIKFRITKAKKKEEGTKNGRNKTFKYFFILIIKAYVKRTDVAFLSFVFKNMLIMVDFPCRLNFT